MNLVDDITTRQTSLTRLDAVAAKLNEAAAQLQESGVIDPKLIARLVTLRERLLHNQLQLAVVGQFKRGKSTFINALLGAPLLPSAVVPLTSVPVFVSWGAEPRVVVAFGNDQAPQNLVTDNPEEIQQFLYRFVAEEANPQNHLGVARVDLFYPASILAEGTVFIDTPGVGSTFSHNTEAAHQVMPECDAALFIVSADPPISEAEVKHLRDVMSVARETFIILNKIDYLRPDERITAIAFLRRVLERYDLILPSSSIFPVSARDGLDGKMQKDAVKLKSSGLSAIEAHLVRHLAVEKTRMLSAAIRQKALDVLTQVSADVALRIQSLRLPIEQLQTRSTKFEEVLMSLQQQRQTALDVLAGDKRRIRNEVETAITALCSQASQQLTKLINNDLESGATSDALTHQLQKAMEEIFDSARGELTTTFSNQTDKAIVDHQLRIDELVARVRQAAADIFSIPFVPQHEHEQFRLGEDPYWVTENIRATLIPDVSRITDRFLSKGARLTRLRMRMTQQSNDLVVRNGENLRWALLRGIDDSFRNADARLAERFDEVIAGTKGLIDEAMVRRRMKTTEITFDVGRLEKAATQLSKMRRDLMADECGPEG